MPQRITISEKERNGDYYFYLLMQLFQFDRIYLIDYFSLINNELFEEHQLHDNHYDKRVEILTEKENCFFLVEF